MTFGGTVGAHGDDAFVVGVEYGRAGGGEGSDELADFRGNGVARTVVAHVVVADDGDDADARLEQGEFLVHLARAPLAQLADAETVVGAQAQDGFGDVRGPVVSACYTLAPQGEDLQQQQLGRSLPRAARDADIDRLPKHATPVFGERFDGAVVTLIPNMPRTRRGERACCASKRL
jgi:hypothetical protein